MLSFDQCYRLWCGPKCDHIKRRLRYLFYPFWIRQQINLTSFRFAYTLNKDSGIVKGLDGAIQRLIVNGNTFDDLMGQAKNSRGVSRYVGAPCDDPDDAEVPGGVAKSKSGRGGKCQNGGQCFPFFRSYVCKCPPDFMGKRCEKSKKLIFHFEDSHLYM